MTEQQSTHDIIAALSTAAKTLQRVQFILGGHSGIIEDCDEESLRLNVERALALMREKLPSIADAWEGVATIQSQREQIDALTFALQRYVNADDCEYGAGPPCPGAVGVPQCMYCQARAALDAREGVQ